MQFSISHVLFQKWLGTISFDNHLSTVSSQNAMFVSTHSVPRPKFGLLAWGVYRVPLLLFPEELRHCGTFRPIQTYLKDLAFSVAVTDCSVPRLIVSPSTNTTSITASASMDFPHENIKSSRDYPKIALCNIIALRCPEFACQKLPFPNGLSVSKYRS